MEEASQDLAAVVGPIVCHRPTTVVLQPGPESYSDASSNAVSGQSKQSRQSVKVNRWRDRVDRYSEPDPPKQCSSVEAQSKWHGYFGSYAQENARTV